MAGGYLFPVVNKKKREFLASTPSAAADGEKPMVSLGVGDTTHPCPPAVAKAMSDFSLGLSTKEGYEGYDPKAEPELKKKIVSVLYSATDKPLIDTSEVFVSDGSKCDLGRIQTLFGTDATVIETPFISAGDFSLYSLREKLSVSRLFLY